MSILLCCDRTTFLDIALAAECYTEAVREKGAVLYKEMLFEASGLSVGQETLYF